MAKNTATCPACFRKMSVSADGKIGRHGWKESGGRQVGSYGNAWHTGACYGVGHLPFEVSPAGTIGFVADVVFPCALAAEAYVLRLATRPALTYKGAATAWHKEGAYHRPIQCEWAAKVIPGDKRFSEGSVTTPDYEKLWSLRTKEASDGLARNMADGATLTAKIASWTPA